MVNGKEIEYFLLSVLCLLVFNYKENTTSV